jgi:hypothetical protein
MSDAREGRRLAAGASPDVPWVAGVDESTMLARSGSALLARRAPTDARGVSAPSGEDESIPNEALLRDVDGESGVGASEDGEKDGREADEGT